MTRKFSCCGLLLGALSLTAMPSLAQAQSDGSSNSSLAPAVFGGHSFDGLSDAPAGNDKPIVAGAIGPSSYIQAVNGHIGIFNRFTNEEIVKGTLTQLAGSDAKAFNPQIIWDATTGRFYYVMNSGNRLAFGFSKNNNPQTISGDWCHYFHTPAAGRFPDYPRLGDSEHFLIIGVNSYSSNNVQPRNFLGSDIIAINKPPAGASCPGLTRRQEINLQDGASGQIFTPVPANQVDNNPVGYVVARSSDLNQGSAKLWFFNVTRAGNGNPIINRTARGVTVPTFNKPPPAEQPDFVQTLDTLDARLTQAVQAINPLRGTGTNVHSFWVQHTVKHTTDDRSVVRWYEINPRPETPIVLRRGEIGTGSPNDFFFNAAISPDRLSPDGKPDNGDWGDSFVIQYNVVSRARDIPPRIVVGSSLKGAAVTFSRIKDGTDGYRDDTCPDSDNVCRWTISATASPDPRSSSNDRGQVWGSNQYAGDFAANKNNFRTRIFGVRP